MFSAKTQNQADNCRFCWMCRHVCPIGQMTGKEANTPRAKGLLISLSQRGQAYDESIAQTMYECALCGACSNDCATGFEPPVFIREARTIAIVENLAPEPVNQALELLERTGDLHGQEGAPDDAELRSLLCNLPSHADFVLYLSKAAVYRAPGMVSAAIRLLNKANISFTVIWDTPSGAALGDLIGYVDEVRKTAAECVQKLNESGASSIIVLDPSDASFLKQQCASWGLSLNGSLITLTSYLAVLVKEGRLLPRRTQKKTAVFHDPCRLARDLDETEPARELIRSMGFTLQEMFLNRKLTKCCGGEVLNSYAPELTALTSKGRWQDAQRTDADVLITACPGCYHNMSQQIPEGMELFDLITLLAIDCEA